VEAKAKIIAVAAGCVVTIACIAASATASGGACSNLVRISLLAFGAPLPPPNIEDEEDPFLPPITQTSKII
jgi:hypothetical protein